MLLMSKLFDLFDREVSESETASVKPVRLPAPRRRFLWRQKKFFWHGRLRLTQAADAAHGKSQSCKVSCLTGS
jgi:hypothetical protein